jgi:hypothetical protein
MNLLMEKPMTTNVHEAKEMHDVSPLSILIQKRY